MTGFTETDTTHHPTDSSAQATTTLAFDPEVVLAMHYQLNEKNFALLQEGTEVMQSVWADLRGNRAQCKLGLGMHDLSGCDRVGTDDDESAVRWRAQIPLRMPQPVLPFAPASRVLFRLFTSWSVGGESRSELSGWMGTKLFNAQPAFCPNCNFKILEPLRTREPERRGEFTTSCDYVRRYGVCSYEITLRLSDAQNMLFESVADSSVARTDSSSPGTGASHDRPSKAGPHDHPVAFDRAVGCVLVSRLRTRMDRREVQRRWLRGQGPT
eukprot:2288692-Rhodomonas_salina.1